MKELFESINGIVTSAINHDWTDLGTSIVGTVEHGVGLLTKILGLG
ncbi:MAG: beta-class phenol-soluble modulin [Staphylococcus rostri]|uniref:Hemolysin-H1C n=2 Tax=Staphylococcus TaxID=1279 RepID=A0A2K3YL86_9STAP|nr:MULTISPECIES: beta-class phenol-soluble modulin [Staphylococcus]MCS4485878.1 beta-class phenol-soluble modulin [Staphylococcus americanisciuri]MDO5376005.1 beta-class phenol-soluble modulin [Staphylococcus rostri]PNZ26366.1 hemolysin-H1C [Staphylococcus rostri]